MSGTWVSTCHAMCKHKCFLNFVFVQVYMYREKQHVQFTGCSWNADIPVTCIKQCTQNLGEELKHFFNGIAEVDEPPFRCGAADSKIIWENENNTTNGIFVTPPGVNRLSIFYELEYWMVLKINHLLDPMHIFKNISKSLLIHLCEDLDTVSSREDLKLSNTKKNLWRPTAILENGKTVYQTNPYVLIRAE